MFKNYLKVAFRNAKKSRTFSMINITGLSIGMTVCLLMLMYVVNEMSFENFHQNKDNIYRIVLNWGTEESKMKFAGSMPAIAQAVEAQIPEIIKAIRIRRDYDAVLINSQNQPIKEGSVFFADPGIFDIFSFQLYKGDKSTALVEPFTAVISPIIAKKYFGSENPLGQTLNYHDTQLKVVAILEHIPVNTHLNCEILISYSTLKALGEEAAKPWNNWGDDFTYILTENFVSTSTISKKMNELLLQNTSAWFASRMDLILQPLSEIHWDSESRGDIGPKGNLNYVYLFLSAALLILVIACFNFMSLTMSSYFNRMKEVGIRKVMGAKQNQLIKQFLTESILIILVSVAISLVLFEILHRNLYSYLKTEIVFESIHIQYLYLIIIGMIVLVGIIAGGYPALYLSRFRPIEIMRKDFKSGVKRLSFQKVLIVLQFSISIVLIIGSVIIFKQLNFMKNSDVGFEKEGVLLIQVPFANPSFEQKYQLLRDELLTHASIVDLSSAYTVPGINSRMNMSVNKEGEAPENSINMQVLPIDYGFVRALDLKIIAGRDFSKRHSLDQSESVLLNESGVIALGMEKPVGTKLIIPGNGKSREVIGVVEDFHIQSLHHRINPLLLYINPKMAVTVVLKLLPGNNHDTIEFVKQTWNNILPETEFNYKYLKDSYENLYYAEEKTSKLLSIFTVLAVYISCLGLFGLASLIARQKTKEIGIRKVLGATISSIVILFSKEFSIWVIIANILAWPFAWMVIDKWLQNFAYRIEISLWVFVVLGLIVLFIALITISFRAIMAAITNPVEALRYE